MLLVVLGVIAPALLLGSKRRLGRTLGSGRLFGQYLCGAAAMELALDALQAGPWVRTPWFVLLALLEAANLEHVLANDANQHLSFARYLVNPTFLRGSGLSKRFALRAAVMVAMFAAAAQAGALVPREVHLGALAVGLATWIAVPRSATAEPWTQDAWPVTNLRSSRVARASLATALPERASYHKQRLERARADYAALVPQDLSGTPWHAPAPRTNVLLVMVEGLGELHFERGWVPRLAARRSEHVRARAIIAHQRCTNRGVYSILTGVHPNLVSHIAKPDLVAQYGPMEPGLASFLASHGYRTSFMQGAGTVFMSKDRFLPALGFAEVLGAEHAPPNTPRIKWGIDDEALYGWCAARIEQHSRAPEPWFLAALTVSTHHPHQAAGRTFASSAEAFGYADQALDRFLDELERRGVLDTTLVLITSDEVAGDGGHPLAHNLGTLTMLLPGRPRRSIEEPASYADLPLSVCDYLGLAPNPFPGRSVFREYGRARDLHFGNIFDQRAMHYAEGRLTVVHAGGDVRCLALERLSLDADARELPDVERAALERHRAFVRASDRDLSFLTSPILLDWPLLAPSGKDVELAGGAMKTRLARGAGLSITFGATNDARNEPILAEWVLQDMTLRKTRRVNFMLLPGEQRRFERVFESPHDSSYDVSFRVLAQRRSGWEVRDLQVRPL
jgi:hypothetical protein